MSVSASEITLRKLRGRWKPHKERLNGLDTEHPTNVRFHRACSWLQRAEQITERNDLDLTLTTQWIAFNALYGQWDTKRKQPVGDVECWQAFLKTIMELDGDKVIVAVLEAEKRLVMSIFEDEYLNRYFWRNPSESAAKRNRKNKFDTQLWYAQKNWLMLLDQVIDRVYLVRCQLVHGAATFNSRFPIAQAIRKTNPDKSPQPAPAPAWSRRLAGRAGSRACGGCGG
jgi:hypothetical protein